jgi:hypothetical protein
MAIASASETSTLTIDGKTIKYKVNEQRPYESINIELIGIGKHRYSISGIALYTGSSMGKRNVYGEGIINVVNGKKFTIDYDAIGMRAKLIESRDDI